MSKTIKRYLTALDEWVERYFAAILFFGSTAIVAIVAFGISYLLGLSVYSDILAPIVCVALWWGLIWYALRHDYG